LFGVDITAATEEGLRSCHHIQLSKDFAALETATVIVK
jgi:hypothetical protein